MHQRMARGMKKKEVEFLYRAGGAWLYTEWPVSETERIRPASGAGESNRRRRVMSREYVTAF